MQIRPTVFKCTDMQVLPLFWSKFQKTLDISHVILPITVAKLSMLKSSPFLAHHVVLIVLSAAYI